MEEKELEIKHLIALRNNYFSVAVLISSGITGIVLASVLSFKAYALIFIGTYLDYIFISKFIYVNNEIKSLIRRKV